MINTGNPELTAAFVEAAIIVADLAEKNMTKAADIAGLRIKLEAAEKQIAELTKKIEGRKRKPKPDSEVVPDAS